MRPTKWTSVQNQGLIDSLLRGYQIPLFYVHLVPKTNTFTGTVETTAWLVDGQQRLAAIASYLQNEFALSNPQQASPGTILPVRPSELPPWNGKKFADLTLEDRNRLLGRELLIIEMTGEPNEVRDLFIRLQAGTPLTAQEKRDAWPGDFTLFVIRHAGKPGHPLANPKPFFRLVPRHQGLTVDDGDHYVDRLADTRKFFAGLAMTIMVRERSGQDFVDLKGKTINGFYNENFDLREDDPAAGRVIRALDRVAQLPGFENLLARKPMPFSMAFHLALLVDSLNSGNYVPVWRDDVVSAVVKFQDDVAQARLHYKKEKESLPHHGRFAVLLSGSGSDTADVIRSRHAFFLSKVYPAIRIKPRDENRCFGALEKEVIWNRDRGQCKNPDCNRQVPFREATIHHIIEHTVGGTTTLDNGILICPECHADRGEMQRLTTHFQDYIMKANADPIQQGTGEVLPDTRCGQNTKPAEADNGVRELDPENPGSLFYTDILDGNFGPTHVSSWRELIDSAVKTSSQQALPLLVLREIARVQDHDPEAGYFHQVEDTNLWVPGMDSNQCWQRAFRLAQRTNTDIKVLVEWKDTEGAAHPGEKGMLRWTPR